MAKTEDLHISPDIDVEKRSLGPGKFLYHIGDRFFINDRSPDGNLNWKEIPTGEKVFLGQEALYFPPQIFFGNDRITLEAYDLFLSKGSKTLCDHVYFRAEPGTLTGIMGPSGAGKTVLLNLLSGAVSSKENRGKVVINETYDVHRDRPLLGRTIGYVPQDDTLIPHLTVWQSLDYCFRLRYAGVDAGLKEYIIRDACRKSGFSDERLGKLLPTRIGSPDDKTLSGGERKRVNIAHELIRNPLLLFLDEPTSGLSSVDADNVIKSLHDLCEKTHITVILTIHQPSRESFKKLNRLLVVNQGGTMAYFGAAQDAIAYFDDKTAPLGLYYHEHDNPAEFILTALEHWTAHLKARDDKNPSEKIIYDAYRTDSHYFPYTLSKQVLTKLEKENFSKKIIGKLDNLLKGGQFPDKPFFWRREFLTALREKVGSCLTPEIETSIIKQTHQSGSLEELEPRTFKEVRKIPPLSASWWQQFRVLLGRNHTVARTDMGNRCFQVLQPIVIAAFMLIAFSWYNQDYYNENTFARVGYYFTQQLQRTRQINISQDLPQAKQWAHAHKELLSEGAVNRQAAVFFLLIASCIWFGVINSCREIVDERTVLRREVKSVVRVFPYLLAKIVFLGWICLQQTGLLLIVIFLPNLLLHWQLNLIESSVALKNFLRSIQLIPEVNLEYLAVLFALLAITAVLASWLGLFISALAPTQKTALTVVPLVIIPQLLFGGLVRPVKDMDTTEKFMLTSQAFVRLRQELPQAVLERLQSLEEQPFIEQKQFIAEARSLIGDQAIAEYKHLLVEQAAIPSLRERLSAFPLHLHDIILQKWAFKLFLLYHSLGGPTVLQKELDFERYHEYEYLQFKAVYLVEMFFDLPPSGDPPPKIHILWRTIIMLIITHAILLLMPTYIWLRQTLRK
jgi:ABC-type multidrug transport system ATPase subunit